MSNESVLLLSNFFAVLAVLCLVASAGLLIYRLVKGSEAADLLGGNAIWLAFAVALVATIGSLIYSEVIHFVPCRLCWFQRIAMYPLSVILLVGAIRREAVVKFYALPLALIGLAVSIYHNLVQFFPSMEGGSCDPLNPCSARSIAVFGFMDLPFMAGAGFIVIAVLLAFYTKASE
jgi:disulfide bond formation protein DsbB